MVIFIILFGIAQWYLAAEAMKILFKEDFDKHYNEAMIGNLIGVFIVGIFNLIIFMG